MIGDLFHTIFYEPLFNLLVGIYLVLPVQDFAIAIIVLTVLVRLLLAPLTFRALRSQRALQNLQPKLQEVRKRHAKSPQESTKAMIALYKEHKINPLGGFLPIAVQLPLLLALFYVLKAILGDPDAAFASSLYSFLSRPEDFSEVSFSGMLDLSERNLILAVLAGAAQFAQSHLSFQKTPKAQKKGDFASAMALQMRYVFPMMLVVIAAVLPAGIALYILVTTLFSAGQQWRFNQLAATMQKGQPT